ncbi:MAG: HesA/MoeB/ThiF family protein [Bacteroidales bacterium]|nr:HesA/MoeB/ThiF family protein [Bacteroidales bacterium]MBQ9311769.1 HesA/MoeB/ThiF family protein [Bacteroidales bacterium]
MLSKQELNRYQRQIILPDFGEIGQAKLKNAKILIVGVGGLGSVVSLYLTAAGIGTIGLVEKDVVSLHNLQRQVLYREDEIGMSKLECALRTLQRLNKETNFDTYDCFLTEENAEQIIANYDIIMDCTDNYTARYLINDTCVKLGKPFIYGTIGDTKGQMAVFNYGCNPTNYRDLYPNEQALKQQGNINKGVMGVLPSVIASLQVNEAIKIITSTGTVMKDTLFMIDLQTLDTMKFKITK